MTESWIPIPPGSGFGLANLPLAIADPGDGRSRPWVGLGDSALDLAVVGRLGLLDGTGLPQGTFDSTVLNPFLACGPEVWAAVRRRLTEIVTDSSVRTRLSPHVRSRAVLTHAVPLAVGDYVDFYSSLHHATNMGRLLRPDADPLPPHWRTIPIGYHGRSATLIADGSAVDRPRGTRLVGGEARFGPSDALDFELEVATVIGIGNARNDPVEIGSAGSHLYGVCLLNDWSARDIQAFEYQPLGPFLAKSFATSVGPWVVALDALEGHRVAPPVPDPPVAPHLHTNEPWGLDLNLEILLESAVMRADGLAPTVVGRVGFAEMYWTPAQQLTHLTSNGSVVRPGDLLASGTVSGPDPGSEGSLMERTLGGRAPIELPDGTCRTYLHDGDRVTLRGWAGSPEDGIGLGSLSGTVTAAKRS